MNKTETRIYERLLKRSLEDIEKLSVFSRSKTEKALALRLLKLFYKKTKEFKVNYYLAEPFSFPECRETKTIMAFSLSHATQKTLKEDINPTMRRFCTVEESQIINQIIYMKTHDRTEFSENYTTEMFTVEDAKELETCDMAISVVLVKRTNRKNPYYTKLYKELHKNKTPIVRT